MVLIDIDQLSLNLLAKSNTMVIDHSHFPHHLLGSKDSHLSLVSTPIKLYSYVATILIVFFAMGRVLSRPGYDNDFQQGLYRPVYITTYI